MDDYSASLSVQGLWISIVIYSTVRIITVATSLNPCMIILEYPGPGPRLLRLAHSGIFGRYSVAFFVCLPSFVYCPSSIYFVFFFSCRVIIYLIPGF